VRSRSRGVPSARWVPLPPSQSALLAGDVLPEPRGRGPVLTQPAGTFPEMAQTSIDDDVFLKRWRFPVKRTLCVACLFVVALSAGCSASNTAPASPAAIPDLVGTWTGPVKGYIEGVGFGESTNAVMTLVVTEQRDRLFTGYMLFPLLSGETRTEGFAGVIDRDGKTLHLVEYTTGYDDGTIVSANEIELVNFDDSEPAMLGIDTLKRSQ